MDTEKIPGARRDYFVSSVDLSGRWFERTGEYRAPRRGEYFLSAYRDAVAVQALSDFHGPYYILREVGAAILPRPGWVVCRQCHRIDTTGADACPKCGHARGAAWVAEDPEARDAEVRALDEDARDRRRQWEEESRMDAARDRDSD